MRFNGLSTRESVIYNVSRETLVLQQLPHIRKQPQTRFIKE